jgi:hypothetical protein
MCDDLLEAWRTNNRISLHLIDRISDAGMQSTLSKRGGRVVAVLLTLKASGETLDRQASYAIWGWDQM